MATVTGFTAARMLEIENSTIVDGNVVGDNLILITRGGTQIPAGSVRGPQGIQGPVGEVTTAAMNAAIEASRATIQAAGAVTNAMIALGAITTDRLADLAVTTAKLAEGAVTTSKLGDSQVTTAKLADGNVTAAKIASNTITAAQIAADAIGSSEISSSAVGTTQLANGAVTSAKQSFVFVQASQPAGVTGGVWIIP